MILTSPLVNPPANLSTLSYPVDINFDSLELISVIAKFKESFILKSCDGLISIRLPRSVCVSRRVSCADDIFLEALSLISVAFSINCLSKYFSYICYA